MNSNSTSKVDESNDISHNAIDRYENSGLHCKRD